MAKPERELIEFMNRPARMGEPVSTEDQKESFCFHIDDDGKANWVLRKIRHLKKKQKVNEYSSGKKHVENFKRND